MRLATLRAAMRRGWVWPIRPCDAAAELQADFRQLRGFARAGFAADDDDLMFKNRFLDLVTLGGDRQVFVVAHGGYALRATDYTGTRCLHALDPLRQLRLVRFLAQLMQLPAQAMTIADHRVVEVFEELVDGGRIVGHQGAESFYLNAGRGLSQIWWGGCRSVAQSPHDHGEGGECTTRELWECPGSLPPSSARGRDIEGLCQKMNGGHAGPSRLKLGPTGVASKIRDIGFNDAGLVGRELARGAGALRRFL